MEQAKQVEQAKNHKQLIKFFFFSCMYIESSQLFKVSDIFYRVRYDTKTNTVLKDKVVIESFVIVSYKSVALTPLAKNELAKVVGKVELPCLRRLLLHSLFEQMMVYSFFLILYKDWKIYSCLRSSIVT